jgi:hypothetical protein
LISSTEAVKTSLNLSSDRSSAKHRNLPTHSTQIAHLQANMRPQNINLAYAETMGTCLAVQHNQECLHNPRWIEEDWSEERAHVLQRELHAFEFDAESYSHEQRIMLSRRIVHGQVCLYHSRYCAERLHILQMIRGDARSDLHEPTTTRLRGGRARTAAARAARKRALWAARSLTPEQGRPCPDDLLDELESGPPSLTSMLLCRQKVGIDADAVHRLFRSINHCHIYGC